MVDLSIPQRGGPVWVVAAVRLSSTAVRYILTSLVAFPFYYVAFIIAMMYRCVGLSPIITNTVVRYVRGTAVSITSNDIH